MEKVHNDSYTLQLERNHLNIETKEVHEISRATEEQNFLNSETRKITEPHKQETKMTNQVKVLFQTSRDDSYYM